MKEFIIRVTETKKGEDLLTKNTGFGPLELLGILQVVYKRLLDNVSFENK